MRHELAAAATGRKHWSLDASTIGTNPCYGEIGALSTKNVRPTAKLAALLYADCSLLPALLIQGGSDKTLLDHATRLTERARAMGVDVTLEVWNDMPRVWHMFAPILPEGQRAIERIGEFMRE